MHVSQVPAMTEAAAKTANTGKDGDEADLEQQRPAPGSQQQALGVVPGWADGVDGGELPHGSSPRTSDGEKHTSCQGTRLGLITQTARDCSGWRPGEREIGAAVRRA